MSPRDGAKTFWQLKKIRRRRQETVDGLPAVARNNVAPITEEIADIFWFHLPETLAIPHQNGSLTL